VTCGYFIKYVTKYEHLNNGKLKMENGKLNGASLRGGNADEAIQKNFDWIYLSQNATFSCLLFGRVLSLAMTEIIFHFQFSIFHYKKGRASK